MSKGLQSDLFEPTRFTGPLFLNLGEKILVAVEVDLRVLLFLSSHSRRSENCGDDHIGLLTIARHRR